MPNKPFLLISSIRNPLQKAAQSLLPPTCPGLSVGEEEVVEVAVEEGGQRSFEPSPHFCRMVAHIVVGDETQLSVDPDDRVAEVEAVPRGIEQGGFLGAELPDGKGENSSRKRVAVEKRGNFLPLGELVEAVTMTPDGEAESVPETVAVTVMMAVRQVGVPWGTGGKEIESLGRNTRVDDDRGIGIGKIVGVDGLSYPLVKRRPVINAGNDFLHRRLLSWVPCLGNVFPLIFHPF